MKCDECKLKQIIEKLLSALSNIFDKTEEEAIENISINALRQAENDYEQFKKDDNNER